MQRHKIVARAILLILSLINLALAAPVFVWEKRDLPTDVTTALRERHNGHIPSDEWSTSASDRENAPQSLASSYSESDSDAANEHSSRNPSNLALELGPPGSDSESHKDSPFSSVASTTVGHFPVPEDSPPPNNLRLDLGLNTFSNLNPDPQPSPAGPTDSSGFASHLTGPSKPEHGRPYLPTTGFEASSAPDPIPPLRLGHGNLLNPPPLTSPGPQSMSLEEYLNRLSNPGLTNDQPLTAPPLDPGPSTWANPPLDARPSAPHPPPSPGPPQHESEIIFLELFEKVSKGGRFKRHISHSHPENEGVT